MQVNTSKSLERRQASKPARNMRKVAGHLGLHCSKAGPRSGQTLIYSSVLIFHGIKLIKAQNFWSILETCCGHRFARAQFCVMTVGKLAFRCRQHGEKSWRSERVSGASWLSQIGFTSEERPCSQKGQATGIWQDTSGENSKVERRCSKNTWRWALGGRKGC